MQPGQTANPPGSGRVGRCLALTLLLWLGGCASGPPLHDWPATAGGERILPEEITEVPFFPQERYQCGPAALAGVLNWSGVETTPDELSPYLYIPERQGTLQPELLAQSRRLGRIPFVIPAHPSALQAELAERHPVLVLQNNGLNWYPKWHYAVVVGVEADEDGDRVVLRSGDMQHYLLAADTFMHTWRRSSYWGVVVLPPGELPASVDAGEALRAINDFSRVADFADVMQALEAAAGRWPQDLGIQFAMGNHLYAGGDVAGAERAYRDALAAHPGTLLLHNNLAWLLAEQGRIAEAQVHIAAAQDALARAVDSRYAEEVADTAAFVTCRSAGTGNDECQRQLAREREQQPQPASGD